MRSLFVGLLIAVNLGPVYASVPRHFEDATLRAVHFSDDKEGWAVGDEGVIWHTIDGGRNWERQSSGTAGSLRSVHFIDPYIGWIAGREELPGGGACGVVLYTTDGGQQWRRILMNSLPGLHLVRFVGPKTGYLAGDGSEQFPSGVFATTNAGRDWQPVPGPRASSWRGGDFNVEGGAMGGAWNRLATVRRGQVFSVEMDSLGGRAITGLALRGDDGIAVGQGGLVLESRKTRGSSWHFVETKLGREALEQFDFHGVAAVGSRVWAVGKPGSAILVGEGGKWELVPTRQTMPLHGIFFRDEKRGWAVGELGTILATTDGGRTWEVKQRGGQRLAILCIHARPNRALPDVVARMGLGDGYLMGGLCITGPEPASADLARVSDAARFEEAFRQSGGVCAGQLWHFPIGSHLSKADTSMLVATWDKLHDDRAMQMMLGQIVQAIRAYKPEIVLCDGLGDDGASTLVHEAVKEACKQAGDPTAFETQTKTLGLEPWKPRKAYALSATGSVSLDQTEVSPVLMTTPREYATGPAVIFGQRTPPATRSFTLVMAGMPGAEMHTSLMQGIALSPGGVARRAVTAALELSAEVKSAIRTRTQLWAMAEAPESAVNRPERLLADLGRQVSAMPDEVGARVAHGLGRLYAQRGQWSLAREAFFVLADRYPTHPLAVDGYRWLLMHQASSEVRRRYELGQFVVITDEQYGTPGVPVKPMGPMGPKGAKLPEVPAFETQTMRMIAHRSGRDDARKWLQDCLELEQRLNTFGPLHAGDARVGFSLQAVRRQLGQVEETRKWYRDFAARQPEGPWRNLAVGEIWLAERRGASPRPTLTCPPTEERPYLDGKLDDPCWQAAKPLTLRAADAASGLDKSHPTEVRMLYDREYLYVAVRCAGRPTPARKPRTRDEDMRAYDRVSLMFDVDRDYNTCFHFQVDARGCVGDDCWGDKTWDPKWFVAVHREAESWTMELAIPRHLLAGEALLPGQAWAMNVVRTLPAQGVAAMGLPAEAPETAIRPEGMGLLLFTGNDRAEASRK